MRALILSCGMGGGHNAAGHALKEEMVRRGYEAVMLNPYMLRSTYLAAKINETYVSLVQKTPSAFGAVYTAGELYRRLPCYSPIYYINGGMRAVLQEYLEKNTFDVILMPHLFPAEILTNMKRHGLKVPPTVFVATDYTCIPFTEESDCDAYIVPSEELIPSFTKKGIPGDKIYALGIPVHQSFSAPVSRYEAKARLGFDEEKRYILISGGGIGAGEIRKIFKILYDGMGQEGDLRFVVICGNNRKLYAWMEKKYGGRIELVGHTDKMALYLRASDLFLTKPGGLSSTEAAVMGVPLLHLPPIPGCETHNARYFAGHGMSRRLPISKRSLAVVQELMENETVRNGLIHRQSEWIPKDAASRICDLACEIVRGREKNG